MSHEKESGGVVQMQYKVYIVCLDDCGRVKSQIIKEDGSEAKISPNNFEVKYFEVWLSL